MIPVGRIGTAEDMGHAYLFLASKESGFVSGITLHSNGGCNANVNFKKIIMNNNKAYSTN